MNFRALAFAASFCVVVASLASAQHCDSCHRSHAVWHGYCDKGCGGCDSCCDPCCTRRYGLLRGIGRVVVGAVRVVDNLIPRPCVNCACSPCGGSGHSVGCSDGCCGGGGGDYHDGEVIHSGSAPISEEILPTPAPAEATHSIRKTRSVISSGRKKSAPTPARAPRQISAKPAVESESKVALADYEEEAADEVPTLAEAPRAEVKKQVSKKATTVAKKKSESTKNIPVNPLR
jgi:hypothetical protein